MHDKVLRDLRPVLDRLERIDKAGYIEVEKILLNAYGTAIYRLEKAELAKKLGRK